MPEARPRVLVVDGHSMIFQWPELRKLHGKNTGTAREQLTRLLTRYQDASGAHVCVVFDGKGSKSTEEKNPGGIQIFYSGSAKTADSIIERIVATYASKYDIVVATDDNLERTTVETFGGSWMSSEQLMLELQGADADLSDRIDRLRRR
ncbi:MAG TPA: NYN domain-containing protein [Chthoniobacterales bacterium]|nr:NYN domain-containing protein [Chthoniobacterales bacterium]